jgi:hypothetical protein
MHAVVPSHVMFSATNGRLVLWGSLKSATVWEGLGIPAWKPCSQGGRGCVVRIPLDCRHKVLQGGDMCGNSATRRSGDVTPDGRPTGNQECSVYHRKHNDARCLRCMWVVRVLLRNATKRLPDLTACLLAFTQRAAASHWMGVQLVRFVEEGRVHDGVARGDGNVENEEQVAKP